MKLLIKLVRGGLISTIQWGKKNFAEEKFTLDEDHVVGGPLLYINHSFKRANIDIHKGYV